MTCMRDSESLSSKLTDRRRLEDTCKTHPAGTVVQEASCMMHLERVSGAGFQEGIIMDIWGASVMCNAFSETNARHNSFG